MMRLYLLAIISVVLISCSPKENQEVETISIEELMGEVDDYTMDSLVKEIDTLEFDKTALSNLILSLTNYDTLPLNTGHPIDRYGFNTSKKVQFMGVEKIPYGKSAMVTPKADLYVYHFSDSLKLNNAFYNWLDCYGSDCNEVKLNQDVESIKTPPSLTLVYDTTLVTIKYMCEHQKNDWKSFQDSVLNYYGRNYRYRIDVECGGPLIWR